MADPKKMSVEEILAACRAADGGGSAGGSAEPSEAPAEPAQQQSAPASTSSASSGSSSSAPKKKPKEMSVEEMLAAARAEKSGGAAGAATPKPAAPKPAAKVKLGGKKPAPKSKAASGAGAGAAAPMDTASILAAARSSAKRGPVSKSEAAREGKPVPAKPRTPVMPAKPDFLARPPAAAKPAETRRGFFGALAGIAFGSAMAVGYVSLAVTSLLGVLGFARFMFPNILIEPPTRFRVGFPDEFGPGQVQTKFKAQFGVWIVRNDYEGEDVIYALRSVCTHLGCTPNWLEAEQKFKCPCHGSGFYKSGVNFEGPAPRPLERFAIRVADDGQLEVDKSQIFRQEMGQWSNPDSFVTV